MILMSVGDVLVLRSGGYKRVILSHSKGVHMNEKKEKMFRIGTMIGSILLSVLLPSFQL